MLSERVIALCSFQMIVMTFVKHAVNGTLDIFVRSKCQYCNHALRCTPGE